MRSSTIPDSSYTSGICIYLRSVLAIMMLDCIICHDCSFSSLRILIFTYCQVIFLSDSPSKMMCIMPMKRFNCTFQLLPFYNLLLILQFSVAYLYKHPPKITPSCADIIIMTVSFHPLFPLLGVILSAFYIWKIEQSISRLRIAPVV